jgi:hypothetical protein
MLPAGEMLAALVESWLVPAPNLRQETTVATDLMAPDLI